MAALVLGYPYQRSHLFDENGEPTVKFKKYVNDWFPGQTPGNLELSWQERKPEGIFSLWGTCDPANPVLLGVVVYQGGENDECYLVDNFPSLLDKKWAVIAQSAQNHAFEMGLIKDRLPVSFLLSTV